MYGKKGFKLKRIFQKLDIFPQKFSFNINGEEKKTTLYGGIISLFTLICSCTAIGLFIWRFISWRKPSVIQEKLYGSSVIREEITPDKVEMAFSIADILNFDLKTINLTSSYIMTFKGEISKLSANNSKVNQNPISIIGNVVKGSLRKDQEVIQYMTSSNFFRNLDDVLTFNFFNSTFSLGGGLSTDSFATVDISFSVDTCGFLPYICQNSTLLSMITQSYQYMIIYKNNYFNYTEEKGYTSSWGSERAPVSIGEDVNINVVLVKNQIVSDDDYFIEAKKKDFFYTIESISYTTTPKKGNDLNISTVNVHLGMPTYFNRFTRSYPKVDSMLASTMAVINLIMIFSRQLAIFLNKGALNQFMMNKLYTVKSKEIKGNHKNIKKLVRKNTIRNYPSAGRKFSSDLFSINENQNIIHKDTILLSPMKSLKNEERISTIKSFCIDDSDALKMASQNKGKKFHLSWAKIISFKYCSRLIGNPDNNTKNYFYAEEMLRYDLNIVEILKKLIHYESFIKVVLHENLINAVKSNLRRQVDTEKDLFEFINSYRSMFHMGVDKEAISKVAEGIKNCSKIIRGKEERMLRLLSGDFQL